MVKMQAPGPEDWQRTSLGEDFTGSWDRQVSSYSICNLVAGFYIFVYRLKLLFKAFFTWATSGVKDKNRRVEPQFYTHLKPTIQSEEAVHMMQKMYAASQVDRQYHRYQTRWFKSNSWLASINPIENFCSAKKIKGILEAAGLPPEHLTADAYSHSEKRSSTKRFSEKWELTEPFFYVTICNHHLILH